jgi:hypothetical protein
MRRVALNMCAAGREPLERQRRVRRGLPADPSVEVGEPGGEHGERLRCGERLAQQIEGGLFRGYPAEGGGEDLGRGRRRVAVLQVEGVADDQGGVVMAATGHADVEGFGGGGVVSDEHGPIDGDTLGLVDSEGVGEG